MKLGTLAGYWRRPPTYNGKFKALLEQFPGIFIFDGDYVRLVANFDSRTFEGEAAAALKEAEIKAAAARKEAEIKAAAERRVEAAERRRAIVPAHLPLRCRVVLDLDQTLIHMTAARDMPATASQIAEAVVPLGGHAIAVRPGAGALIDGLLATNAVDVRVVTLNLSGAEAVRAIGRSVAPFARAWAELDVTVVDGPERSRRGGRESKGLEAGARCYEPALTTVSKRTTNVAEGMLCILDDQVEAWKVPLRPYVARIAPYRVDEPIKTPEALAASLGYLGDLTVDLLRAVARGVVWPLPPRWCDGA